MRKEAETEYMTFPENLLRDVWWDLDDVQFDKCIKKYMNLYHTNKGVRGTLMYLIYSLDEDLALCVQRNYIENKSCDEISEELGITKDKVKKMFRDAQNAIYKVLDIDTMDMDILEEAKKERNIAIEACKKEAYNRGVDAAARIISGQMELFVKEVSLQGICNQLDTMESNPYLNYTIEDFCRTFDLPARCVNVANKDRIYVKDLLEVSKRKLKRTRQFGEESFRALENALNTVGIYLNEEVEE